MSLFVLILMILSGILFIVSVLLMSPKWWLWFWVWWMSTSNEYWSKKSIETTLKKSALFAIILFTVCAIIYPYIAKDKLVWPNRQAAWQIQGPQQTPENIKIVDWSWNVIPISWSNIKISPATWSKLNLSWSSESHSTWTNSSTGTWN